MASLTEINQERSWVTWTFSLVILGRGTVRNSSGTFFILSRFLGRNSSEISLSGWHIFRAEQSKKAPCIRYAKCDIFLVTMDPILKSTYSEMAAKFQHLAKTESLLIFVEQKLSSSPMHTDKLARLCGTAIKLIETHSNSFQGHSQKVWYCWYQISH